MKLPRIRCARCNKPVDLVEVSEYHDTDETIITARCHGAIESMAFSAASLLHMTNKQLDELRNQEGVAFATGPRALEGGADAGS